MLYAVKINTFNWEFLPVKTHGKGLGIGGADVSEHQLHKHLSVSRALRGFDGLASGSTCTIEPLRWIAGCVHSRSNDRSIIASRGASRTECE